MALVVKSTGNIIATTDVNQYHDLLTGAMTDQPATLSYAPVTLGTVPTLKLVTNGNADILQGYNGATQKFSVDATGILTAYVVNWGVGASGQYSRVTYDAGNHWTDYWTPQAGASAQAHQFVTWDGSVQKVPFAIGAAAIAHAYVDNGGNFFGAGAQLGDKLYGSGTSDQGFITSSVQAVLGGTVVWLKQNNYNDGTNDRFTASSVAYQVTLNPASTGGISPAVRGNTNTPSAGAIIAWGGWSSLAALRSAGGGVAGSSLFVGTSDPGTNAAEGDIWVVG